ncbi:MAG TPA: hypothetical protein VGC93_04840 [Thermoanaerobaculia bacterium]|jgi:hypothetical protein
MSADISHADLYERLGALHARMDNVERRIEKIDANVERLAAAAQMGRGAWWAATKLGGLLLLAMGALGWLWAQVRPLLDRWGA